MPRDLGLRRRGPGQRGRRWEGHFKKGPAARPVVSVDPRPPALSGPRQPPTRQREERGHAGSTHARGFAPGRRGRRPRVGAPPSPLAARGKGPLIPDQASPNSACPHPGETKDSERSGLKNQLLGMPQRPPRVHASSTASGQSGRLPVGLPRTRAGLEKSHRSLRSGQKLSKPASPAVCVLGAGRWGGDRCWCWSGACLLFPSLFPNCREVRGH